MLKQQLSHLLYTSGVGCGLHHCTRRLLRNKAVILMYHRLHAGEADALENFDGQYVHVEHFARQMRYLAEHFTVLPLAQCFADDAPPHCAAVTFDDGYASIYQYAYPILCELGIPATVFVPTDFVVHRTLMWWDRLRIGIRNCTVPLIEVPHNGGVHTLHLRSRQEKLQALHRLAILLRRVPDSLREEILTALHPQHDHIPLTAQSAPLTVSQIQAMASNHITFASHGQSHRSFATLSTEELWQEAQTSKARIEAWTKQSVTWLAYPYGDFDDRAHLVLPQVGYHGAVTTIDGLSHRQQPFAVRRIAVGGATTFPQFVAAVCGLREVISSILGKEAKRSTGTMVQPQG